METPENTPPAAEGSTPDQQALIAELREIVGSKLVAYIGSKSHTRFVSEWADGLSTPAPEVVARLRVARDIAVALHERDGNATIQSWFMGMNPDLDDMSPARLLREGNCDDVGNVKSAANNFVVYG